MEPRPTSCPRPLVRRLGTVAAALALALCGAGQARAAPAAPAPPLHADSWSRSLLVVQSDGLDVFLRVQVLSLLEVLPALDADGSRFVEPAELEAVRAEVIAYLQAHHVVSDPGGPLPLAATALELRTDDQDALAFQQFVDLRRHLAWDRPPPELTVEATLFLDTSPLHTEVCRVVHADGSEQEARLLGSSPAAVFRPAAPAPAPSAAREVLLGVHHVVTGWDHVAFLLGLLVASRRPSSLVGVVTAFTLAHSCTLALAALEVVRLPERPVEIGIALSIAWVGLANLLRGGARPLWLEALVFGLVHGLGFASLLAEQLAASSGRLRVLVLFNVGLELGQLALVAAAVLLLRLAWRAAGADEGGAPAAGAPAASRPLAPRPVRVAVSCAVLLLGLGWSVQRLLGA